MTRFEKAIAEAHSAAESTGKPYCVIMGTTSNFITTTLKMIQDSPNALPDVEMVYRTDRGFTVKSPFQCVECPNLNFQNDMV